MTNENVISTAKVDSINKEAIDEINDLDYSISVDGALAWPLWELHGPSESLICLVNASNALRLALAKSYDLPPQTLSAWNLQPIQALLEETSGSSIL